MLTNQDRRAILEQVKASGSGDIISALRGQVIPESPQQQTPTPQAVKLPPTSPPPVQNVSMDTTPSTLSSLVDSSSNTSPQIQDLPTGSAEPQILKTGGYVQKYPHGGPHAPPVPENNAKIYPTEEKSWWDKTLNVLANPLAAFGRSVRGEDINPGNIPRGENPFDAFVLGMVNPASWAESGQYAVKEAKQGNYLASGLNALGVLPIVPAGIKGASALKNIVKTSKPIRGTGLVKATHTPKTPKDVFTPNRTESYKIDVIKKENINYLKSDEYMSKRMANTGESKESILRQIDDYIKELDETPISFQASDDMGDALGYYKKGDPFENIPSKIAIEEPRTAYQFIDKDMFGTIDHEIKHLLSPAQKFDKSSSAYKLFNSPKFQEGRKKYLQAIDDINDKFMKATSKEEADKILSMYDKIPNKEIFDGTFTHNIPRMEKVYKNYPTLKIDKSAGKKLNEYLGKAKEQQPRLLRGAQWVKDNFNWDGTKSGITDKMVNNIFNQMQNPKNLGGKTSIPDDFRTLLENSKIYMSGTDEYGLHSVESYRKLKNVLSKAWATVPVAVGAGAATSENKEETVSFKDGGWSTFGKTGKFLKEDAFSKDNIMSVLNLNVKKDLEEGTPTVLYGYTNDQMTMNDLERMKQYIKTKGLNVKQYFDAYIRGDEIKRKEIENYRKKNPDTRIDRSLMRLLGRSALMLSPLDAGVGSTLIDPDTGVHKITGEKFDMKFEDGGLRDHMMEYINFSGRDTNNVNLVMNAIAEHESGNVTDKIQISGNEEDGFYEGPGRGAYQFEIGDKKGANTAMNRAANFLASPANRTYFGSTKTIKDFSNIYNKYISSASQDFSKLSRDDQDALFLTDKLYGGPERRNNFDKVLKNPTQENVFMYWLTDHKGKVNGKNIKDLTEKEIEVERKKWKSRTKNMFK